MELYRDGEYACDLVDTLIPPRKSHITSYIFLYYPPLLVMNSCPARSPVLGLWSIPGHHAQASHLEPLRFRLFPDNTTTVIIDKELGLSKIDC